MKITIESTTRIVVADGIQCRVWEGETVRGVKVSCLIARIAVKCNQDVTQFEEELREQRAPSAEGCEVFPLRMVL